MEKWTCSGAMCLKIVAFAVEHRSHNVQNKEDGLGQVTWYMPVDGFLGVVGLATSCADIGKPNPKITSLKSPASFSASAFTLIELPRKT